MDAVIREVLLFTADAGLSIGLVKGSLLVVLAFLLAGALRGTSAAVRSWAWSLSISALAILPLVGTLIPSWEAAVLAFPEALFAKGTIAQSALGARFPTVGVWESPLAVWLGLAWLIGTAVLGVQFLGQRVAADMVARTGHAVRNRRVLETLRRLRQELGVRRPIRLVLSDLATGPYAFGLLRPTVVLPRSAVGWDDGQLEAVLRHELAHVTRGDYLMLLVGEGVRCLYWPNPLVWVALASLRSTQDSACDDSVIRSGVLPSTYARTLVALARSMTKPPLERGALALLRGCDVRHRVGAVLDRSLDRGPASARGLAWGGAAAGLLTLTIASADFWICPVGEPSQATVAGEAGPAALSSASVKLLHEAPGSPAVTSHQRKG